MEQQNQAILTTKLSEQISACAFSKADLQALCERLQEWSDKASEEEISHYSPLDLTPEQRSANIASLREGFKINVTVQGIDDERIYGTILATFNSPHFPDQVTSLTHSEAKAQRPKRPSAPHAPYTTSAEPVATSHRPKPPKPPTTSSPPRTAYSSTDRLPASPSRSSDQLTATSPRSSTKSERMNSSR